MAQDDWKTFLMLLQKHCICVKEIKKNKLAVRVNVTLVITHVISLSAFHKLFQDATDIDRNFVTFHNFSFDSRCDPAALD